MKRRKKFVQALSLKTHTVSPDLCSWVMAFQLMQWFTPHLLNKSDCTICTARSPLFHLPHQDPTGREVTFGSPQGYGRFITLWNLLYSSVPQDTASEMWYMELGWAVYQSPRPYHTCALPYPGSIQRDILTTRCVLSLPAALVCITASDIKVERPSDDCKQLGWKWAMKEHKMVTGST